MPVLRALLTWVALPLLIAFLAPGFFRLLPMLRDGLLYEWLLGLSLLERIALGLLLAVAAALPVLKRFQVRRDLLAARHFIPLWRGRSRGDISPFGVEYRGTGWTVAITPADRRDEPPGLTIAGDGPGRNRHRLERLLRLAWRLHCAAVAERHTRT
ncbi:MAG TPA: hypothetical protein ENN51_03575 [candidate division WOR-3 bacterium]|uniref:Uncharacterized protein n=1 Tax=candidate division WOR-3 bacterium TaxID=2052148 RepID=A0A7V0XF74_UNCW3|nr:hypothetical protein [candidate division WOR-3 bacterium]